MFQRRRGAKGTARRLWRDRFADAWARVEPLWPGDLYVGHCAKISPDARFSLEKLLTVGNASVIVVISYMYYRSLQVVPRRPIRSLSMHRRRTLIKSRYGNNYHEFLGPPITTLVCCYQPETDNTVHPLRAFIVLHPIPLPPFNELVVAVIMICT
jgi:hypothetical protein